MKTLKEMNLQELVNITAATHGLNTDIESITIMQDIIGHTSIDEVANIANGPHKETFYWIYGECYGTVEAIKYYVNNSETLENRICDRIDEAVSEERNKAEEDQKSGKEEPNHSKDEYLKMCDSRNEYRRKFAEASGKLDNAELKIADMEAEIIKLKAMLFDLMNK